MGKVRKHRQKYHLSLKKSKSSTDLAQNGESQPKETESGKDLFKSTENVFAGIDISWNDLTKSLPKDFDVRSVVSTKSRKELKEEERHLKKKEKIKLRHERFMKKLDVTQQLVKKSKSKKKKKSGNLEAGMSSLLDALPSLQSLAVDSSKKNYEKSKVKQKGILKAKHRLKQQSIDTKVFKQILDDKKFRENPLEAISQYLKQKVAAET